MAAVIVKKHQASKKKINTEAEEDLDVNIMPPPAQRLREGPMEKARLPLKTLKGHRRV